MAQYHARDYGANVNAGVNVNTDHGWGGYQYPGGVPSSLLGTASYGGVTSTVRKELVGLYSLAYRIAKQVHGYTINVKVNGEAWGPWGYENRTISGSSTPSNHSRGKANDWNAPYNGYANGFANIVSDFPPAMVRDIESIGLCWGGRYGDAMHWEYGYSPADVAGHEARARAILGGTTPDNPEEDDMGAAEMSELKEIHRIIDAFNDQMVSRVTALENRLFEGAHSIRGEVGWSAENTVIGGVVPLLNKILLEVTNYDVIIYEDQGGLWRFNVAAGTSEKIPDPSTLAGLQDVLEKAGSKVMYWPGGDVALPGAFGSRDGVIPGPDVVPPLPVTYTVASGDTFNAIAAKLGVTPDALGVANPQVTDRGALDIGQVLVVPPKA